MKKQQKHKFPVELKICEKLEGFGKFRSLKIDRYFYCIFFLVMSTKLLNSKFNDSEFFDESPILCKLKDSLCEQNSNFFQSSHMNVSTILVDNNELIQLVVSCNGSSTTLDIIIPEIEVIKTSDELILSQEMFPNNIEQSKSKNMSVDDLKSLLFDKPKIVMVDKSTSCHLITAQMSQPNIQSQDVSNEIIVNDPNNCSCDDCPFSKDSVSKLKVIFNESEVSLNDKESVLLIPFSNKLADTNNRNSFLEITSCMPIRGGKLVLHWKVESYKGVLGYRVSEYSLFQCFYLN